MVATGVHVLLGMALVTVIGRSRRAEPYLVAALAAALPDIDTFVFRPLVEFGHVGGVLWSHRALTHSLLAGILVIALCSAVGPWWAAAIGFGSHVATDLLSGGVRLLAPVDTTVYGLSIDWLLLNALTSILAVTVILGGLIGMKSDPRSRVAPHTPDSVVEWLR
ncbi:metal-dependent hydrolase [Natrinema longum]|uniref:Metal-dependent hydrolase n=1 Tax=Natrinema longum TaxID=370324 RepID=A0A8A2UK40_9EURY|nr:metal-dependent hydrolase [Natrinema longum]MBZ6494108.1 metal-dependent hydrolase [Natrinema longum]QSW87008.1 metal-dependent hydrolase [Natrinema longum]